MRRAGLIATAAVVVPMLPGCTYHTPIGPRIGTPVVSWTFPVGPGSAAPNDPFARGVPPSSLGVPQGTLPPAPDLSGSYSGMATNVFNPGQNFDCADLAIHGSFTVSGRQARFFAFTGMIQPDGQVVMQAGDKWISGRFIGRSFQGELLRRFPACSWNLSLVAS